MLYPLSNIVIEALPESSRRKLSSLLIRVTVPVRTSLYEPNEMPKYAHFLTSGIASVVASTRDGSSVEVGTIGREGTPQGLHLLGSAPVPTRCFMQIGGTGFRLEMNALQRLFDSDDGLRRAMLAFAQYHSLMLAQVAGCNRLHGAEGRLARWLLMIQDRTSNALLKLTQEFVGEMIGSQRTTVSEIAGALQERGLIEYARGSIRILDRIGLENTACECYPVTRKLLASLYQSARQPLCCDETL